MAFSSPHFSLMPPWDRGRLARAVGQDAAKKRGRDARGPMAASRGERGKSQQSREKCGLARPRKGRRESRDLVRQPIRLRRHEIAQLARQHGIDRLSIPRRQSFDREHLGQLFLNYSREVKALQSGLKIFSASGMNSRRWPCRLLVRAPRPTDSSLVAPKRGRCLFGGKRPSQRV